MTISNNGILKPPPPVGRPWLALDPMPVAPPEIAAKWLERVRLGNLLSLAFIPLSFCMGLPTMLWGAPIPVGSTCAQLFVTSLYVMPVWLSTAGEPGRPGWLVYLRWAARAGWIFALVLPVLRLSIGGVLQVSFATDYQLASTHAFLEFASLACGLAAVIYLLRFSDRLGDRVLRINFAIFKWIWVVRVVVAGILMLADHRGVIQEQMDGIHRQFDAPTPWQPKTGVLLGWLAFYAATGIWGVWVILRFMRRLRQAADRIRGSDAAVAPPGEPENATAAE